MSRFLDRVVLVTGASRGLGRAIAGAFADEGARVWLGYRAREGDAVAAAAAIAKTGGRARSIGFDVRDTQAVNRAVERIVEEEGRLEVLVNNAAVSSDTWFPLIDDASWNDVLSTNLLGTVACCRAAVKAMWRARRGAIVNIASVSGMAASPGQANYAASKAGVIGLTRTLGAELGPKGIRVNAVVPGLLAEGMSQSLDRRIVEARLERTPLGRLGTCDEVARAVLFLASDEASFIVGQSLVVDGGLTL